MADKVEVARDAVTHGKSQATRLPSQFPVISAVAFEGIRVTDSAGNPASLAVVDSLGRVLASGPEVADAAWQASVLAYRNFLIGEGHLRVLKEPRDG